MTDQQTSPTRKRSIVAGLTAGLIGGAAAGIAFGVPTLTGAADDDPALSSTTLQPSDSEDAVDEDSATDDADDADRAAEEGDRLREVLQPLVDDGTLDDAQVDAVVDQLLENRPEWGGPHGHGERGGRRGPGELGGVDGRGPFWGDTVAEVLGLEPDELFDELRDGTSLADVATANGVDPQELVDALVAEAQQQLDEAVASGRLDADEADERAAGLEERITEMVENVRPDHHGRSDADDTDSGDTDSDDSGSSSTDSGN